MSLRRSPKPFLLPYLLVSLDRHRHHHHHPFRPNFHPLPKLLTMYLYLHQSRLGHPFQTCSMKMTHLRRQITPLSQRLHPGHPTPNCSASTNKSTASYPRSSTPFPKRLPLTPKDYVRNSRIFWPGNPQSKMKWHVSRLFVTCVGLWRTGPGKPSSKRNPT